MKTHLIIITILFSAQILFAQQAVDFYEVTAAKHNYFQQVGKKGFEYKQFKRWEWYNSTRLSPDGKLVDTWEKNLNAVQEVNNNSTTRTNAPQVNTGSWSFLGPSLVSSTDRGVGRVNRLAFHPTNENIIYAAGATGGLWITTDGGSNWYSYSEGIPNMSLTGVAVNYNNTNTIYILTGDGDAGGPGTEKGFAKASIGVLKSLDGGFTWNRTALKWNETDYVNAYELSMHPSNPEILMVASTEGIHRSTNGGDTWINLVNDVDFYDIEFHPSNSAVVYATGKTADSIEFYKSTNTGQSFSKTWAVKRENNYTNVLGFNRSTIAVTPNNSSYVYLFAGPCTSAGNFNGIYRSTDQGNTFTLRANSPNLLGRSSAGSDAEDQEGYDLAMAVNPTNAAQLITGGIRVWTSTNGGSSFTYQDNYVSTFDYYHDDIHELVYHPLNSSKLYMCGDGGVYLSSSNGSTWSALTRQPQVTQYYKIAHNPATGLGFENIIIGGTQDNGTNKRNSGGGSDFSKIVGKDGMDCFIDPDNINVYVASAQNGEFYYSNNSGSSFETVGDPESITTAIGKNVSGRWVTPVAEITGISSQFIIGYNPVIKVNRLLANAFAFTNIGGEAGSQVSGRTLLKTARGNASRIYAGDANSTGAANPRFREIHTTTDGGTNWSLIFFQEYGTGFTDLAFDSDNGNTIWITFGGYEAGKKVFYTSTGGGTATGSWTNISGSLPNVPINCIVFADNNGNPGGAVYIGTDIGVFYRDNNLGDWIPFSNGLPVVEITDLEIHEATGKLRAGTYGRGIWESDLYTNCPASITLNTSNTQIFKPYFFQASQNVISTAVHAGMGAYVYYKAGTEVVLSPGFIMTASEDNEFKSFISPCGGGVPSKPIVPLKGFLRR